MAQKEIQLLLVDISARLSYGVKGIITYDESDTTFSVEGIDNIVLHLSDAEECYVEDFKPYLRPMSSMTEEEKEEYHKLSDNYYGIYFDSVKSIDWLNKKMFDYRGLIPMGLALEAPEGMY